MWRNKYGWGGKMGITITALESYLELPSKVDNVYSQNSTVLLRELAYQGETLVQGGMCKDVYFWIIWYLLQD